KYINPLIKTLDSYFFTGKNEWELSVISNIKKAFNSVMKNDTGYEFTVRENLSKVCFEIYNLNKKDIFKKNDDSDNDKKRIKLMVEYINQNFHRNISLSQIASSANIGERECMRCFQRMLKISPIQYLMKHRISKGALMLESSSNISLVSRECGFRSPSNFSKTFKKFYKCSPKDYRKKYKKIV
ncbi:MAG TPA: AraC family transcriptional regulator, partial [Tepiditoga sp.]|nr:AraC family transcriptional regulator [Tepiditoga sp.]